MRRHENHPDVVDIPDLTEQEVNAVMRRAFELRCRTARDRQHVQAITRPPHEVKRATQQFYFYTRWYGRMKGKDQSETIWPRMGWIEHDTTPDGYHHPIDLNDYHELWEVLYDAATDRVWLCLERFGRSGGDDPYS